MGVVKKKTGTTDHLPESKMATDESRKAGVRKVSSRNRKTKISNSKNRDDLQDENNTREPPKKSVVPKKKGVKSGKKEKKTVDKAFPEMDPLVLDGTSSLFIDETSNVLNEKPDLAFVMRGKKSPDGSRWADPLNGQRKYGMCFRNGILRIGGKKFVNTLKNASETFLFEILYKSFMMCNVKNRVVVTERMVRGALKTMRIKPMVSF